MPTFACNVLAAAGFDVDPHFTEELVAKVNSALQQGLASGEFTGTWEQICGDGIEARVAWPGHVKPDHCGVHPANRSKFGVGGSESQHLGSRILKVGWSWKKCNESTCFQMPPHPLDAPGIAYNKSLVDLSDALIPPLQMLTHMSIGGGHTNTWLRQCIARSKCILSKPDSDMLVDERGCLSSEKMCIGRPAFEDALQKGLHFLIWHWQAPYIWPAFADFAQEALNTVVQGDQSEVEVMLRLHKLAAAMTRAGKEINWPALEKAATQSMPGCAPWISALSMYVAKNAGGEQGELMIELGQYAKAFGSASGSGPTRILGSEFLLKLASLNFGTGQEFPRIKHACIECQLSSPPHKIVDGVCKLIMPTVLGELARKDKRADVRTAEAAMSEARSLCSSLNVPEDQRARILGRFDVRLMCHLLNKTKDMFGAVGYTTIQGITEVRRHDIVGRVSLFVCCLCIVHMRVCVCVCVLCICVCLCIVHMCRYKCVSPVVQHRFCFYLLAGLLG